MRRLRLEALEERTLLAVTGIDFLSTAGVRLPDFASVADDADVLVRVRTQGMRGEIATVHIYEDDTPFGHDYVGPISFAVPATSDTVVLRFDSSWTDDGFGLFGDPEFEIWASTSPLETVHSQHLTVRARTTASVARLLPAPGRFSMMNCWPSRSATICPVSRATMSLTPPAA